MKVGFGLRRDEPIEEIEVDISSIEEEAAQEEPDVEGEVEVEEPTAEEGESNNRQVNEEL